MHITPPVTVEGFDGCHHPNDVDSCLQCNGLISVFKVICPACCGSPLLPWRPDNKHETAPALGQKLGGAILGTSDVKRAGLGVENSLQHSSI